MTYLLVSILAFLGLAVSVAATVYTFGLDPPDCPEGSMVYCLSYAMQLLRLICALNLIALLVFAFLSYLESPWGRGVVDYLQISGKDFQLITSLFHFTSVIYITFPAAFLIFITVNLRRERRRSWLSSMRDR